MKPIKSVLLALASALLILSQSPAEAKGPPAEANNPPDYVILDVQVSGGAPAYAGLARDFIPTDGTYVPIVWDRAPAFVPGDFNLLDWFDFGAWDVPFLHKGYEWFHIPWYEQPMPFQVIYQNDGPTPIYFVELAELEAAIVDDVLTIGELEALPSLRVGYTRHMWSGAKNGNHPQVHRHTRGWLTAMGEMEGGGGFFVHWLEQVDMETGVRTFKNMTIKFPGAVPAK